MFSNYGMSLNGWRFFVLFVFAFIILAVPGFAYANTVWSPMGNVLCTVSGWFTGNTGKGLATISICIIGIAALQGKVTWGMAMISGIGIAIIFGAPAIVNTMGAGGGSTQLCISH